MKTQWTSDSLMSRERLEAWLATQPQERRFEYLDICGCAVASFIKETTSIQKAEVCDLAANIGDGKGEIEMPRWVGRWLGECSQDPQTGYYANGHTFTISDLCRAYQKLFGVDVRAEYAAPVATVEPVTNPA